ncbi:hypothetical protein BCR33DRAFT_723361 [Rhizoclosmatium globosum]|uniref:EIF3F/CSN6-like C-terminal domain-containing protein n=1 Tax=Rhizoclosmatium globosum TaxID=329046 RepID=A0A1Y2BF36_9FUNG|nr:hypothetical protein HDU99_004304 [Rhizoclosmatium hyalinum]ORY32695.1 hypothetical protein BCR33DRAFT_723361 [Rhizoclosmatium globosum]|eukprot:ORY32695.1 hypothetical protein BCR33DRAFT_723361 [Rhizoclosmatium globosum]
MFIPVPATVKFNEADRSVLDLVSLARPQDYSSDSSNDQEASTTSVYSDMESLERAIISIQGMVDNIQEWVSAVKSGEIPANDAIGRYLLDTVSSVPLIQSTDFEKMFNNHLQDLLMVVYLSNLTRTQLAIAQRLQNLV